MKIVFWNINKNNELRAELALLAKEINPDIIFLAEAENASQILQALNPNELLYHLNPDPRCEKILMFSKYPDSNVRPITSGTRFTVLCIQVPEYPAFNIMALHYQSKVNWDGADQAFQTMELVLQIQSFEQQTNQPNTILIGDFNMNPFETGMVATAGLHAVMSKDIALKMSRIVDGKSYKYFYNPMWSFFGDAGRGDVNGTTYYNLAKPINYFWNIFDQVLIRPELIPYLDEEKLEIITKLGTERSLLTRNKTVDTSISDHLPISVTIKPL